MWVYLVAEWLEATLQQPGARENSSQWACAPGLPLTRAFVGFHQLQTHTRFCSLF